MQPLEAHREAMPEKRSPGTGPGVRRVVRHHTLLQRRRGIYRGVPRSCGYGQDSVSGRPTPVRGRHGGVDGGVGEARRSCQSLASTANAATSPRRTAAPGGRRRATWAARACCSPTSTIAARRWARRRGSSRTWWHCATTRRRTPRTSSSAARPAPTRRTATPAPTKSSWRGRTPAGRGS